MAHHVEDLSSEAKPVSRVGNVMHDRVGQTSNHITAIQNRCAQGNDIVAQQKCEGKSRTRCAIAPCMGYHGAIS